MSADIFKKIDGFFHTFPDDESSQNNILNNLINEKEIFIKFKSTMVYNEYN